MVVELNEQELQMIDRWYHSAAGESCTSYGLNDEELGVFFALLKKLSIELHYLDEEPHREYILLNGDPSAPKPAGIINMPHQRST